MILLLFYISQSEYGLQQWTELLPLSECEMTPGLQLNGTIQGQIQDFKLGGGALKKIVPSGGRREHFWGISCEKSRFYAKKSYFFQFSLKKYITFCEIVRYFEKK